MLLPRFISHPRAHLALIAIFLLPVAIYALATTNIRYLVDDYCNLNLIERLGSIGSLQHWYYSWTGRFVSIIGMIVGFEIGLPGVQFITLLLLCLWWLAIVGSLQRTSEILGLPMSFLACSIIASLVTLGTLQTAPDVFQSVYWGTSVVVYFLPIVLLCIFFWLVIQRRFNTPLTVSIAFIVCFAGAGCLEIFATMLIMGLAIALFLFREQPEIKRRLLGGFAGAVLALALNVVAPGNYVCMSYFGRGGILEIVATTFASLGTSGIVTVIFSPFTSLSLLLIPSVVAYRYDKNRYQNLQFAIVGVPLLTLILTAAYFGPGIYVSRTGLPNRAWMIPGFIFVCGLILWGYVLGLAARPRHLRVKTAPHVKLALIVVLGCALIFSVSKATDVATRLRVFAANWDVQDKLLQDQSGSLETILLVPSVDSFGLDDISADESFWVNQCLAKYYEVTSIKRSEANTIAD